MSKILSKPVNLNSPIITDLSLIFQHISYFDTYFIFNIHKNLLAMKKLLNITSHTFSYNNDIKNKIKQYNQFLTMQHFILKLPYTYKNIFNFKNIHLCLWTSLFNSRISAAPKINMGLVNNNYFCALDTKYTQENCIIDDNNKFTFNSKKCEEWTNILIELALAKSLLFEINN